MVFENDMKHNKSKRFLIETCTLGLSGLSCCVVCRATALLWPKRLLQVGLAPFSDF